MWTFELSRVFPEIFMVSMASLILILDQFVWRLSKSITYLLAQVTLLGAFFLTLQLLGTPSVTIFQNMFLGDDIGNILKLAIYFIGIFVLLYSKHYMARQQVYRGEYYVLCLFSIFGMMVLISGINFLSIYLGLELLALPLYALITIIKEDSVSPEAAMKYFVMGALASGMLLYGISLLYGVIGSFELHEIARYLALQPAETPQIALLFGLVFILTGLAFKFGAVPFHMWLPDVYQGAPMPVTLFIGTLPKIAAFGFAIRLFADTFQVFNTHWQPVMIIMAVLSLTVGNLVAITQTNLKRLLAYSTIAHIGFIFLGLLAGPESGFAAAMDYVIIYALMALGIFGIMSVLSYQGFEAENIEDFRGFGARQPWIAFLLLLLLFSFAGVPPLAGFYAKLFILDALINSGYLWLAVFAVLLTVVGAYYYLRVVRVMFFEEPSEVNPFQTVSKTGVAILSVNTLTILALGLFPTPLLNTCLSVLPIK